MRIGIIGSNTYENKNKIKELLFKIKQSLGSDSIEICSRGDKNGAEKYVKKYALEMGFNYKEFNAAHTQYNLYSALTEAYYNKPYTPGNFSVRDNIFTKYVDNCFCFVDPTTKSKNLQNCIKYLEKNKKKYSIIS